jgi:hypothetical protein
MKGVPVMVSQRREQDNHCFGDSEHPVAILLAGITRATRQSLCGQPDGRGEGCSDGVAER